MYDSNWKISLVYHSYPCHTWWKNLKRSKKNHLNQSVVSMNHISCPTTWFFSSFLQNSSNTSNITILVVVVVVIVDVHHLFQSRSGIVSTVSTNSFRGQTILRKAGTTPFRWDFDFSLNLLLVVSFYLDSEFGQETSHCLWIDQRFEGRATCIFDYDRKSRSWNNENN